MKLILDCGSGNTCKNDTAIVREMIDTIHDIDTGKHEIILKWQLFESAPPNIPLERDVFDYAYRYASELGYETTASVFDESSLEFLQGYDVPFIKIACRPDLYYLADKIDNCYVSIPAWLLGMHDLYLTMTSIYNGVFFMACISKYPAIISDYEKAFPPRLLKSAISDHTIGWDLYNKYKPAILEKHFVHKREADNPDAGAFAVTAEELKEIL